MITRHDAYGRDVTDLPGLWDETDVEIMKDGQRGYSVGIRKVGNKRWIRRVGTVPDVLKWWFSGENQKR